MASEAEADQGPSDPDRRRLLAIAALTGVALVGGGLIVRGSLQTPEVGARINSPGFVARISDIVLPSTTTPGAAAAGVPQFLPIALEHHLFGGDPLTLGKFETVLDGLSGPGGFMAAAPGRQLAIIEKIDAETFARRGPPPKSGSAPAEPLVNALWRAIKLGIVISYYTSEIGGSKELTYQLAAGADYRADVPVGSVPYLSNYWIENAF